MTRVLVGGVGYRNLRDHSIGILLVDRLAPRRAPHVVVEDVSYNPIAVVQWLQDQAPEPPFGAVILAGALQRPDRPAGTLAVYRWDRQLPPDSAIHDAVTEAVTGIIALDNTLVIAEHFHALPAQVVVIEIEPEAHAFGSELTPAVAAALDEAVEIAHRLSCDPAACAHLPQGALPRGRRHHSGVVFAGADVGTRIH